MPRSMWKGAITFGLVNIPVNLYAASERSEEIAFRMLHAKDLSPIQFKRVCSEEGVEVPWGDIVKGYEHEKGQFVVMTDSDFEKARVEATQTIDVRDFVKADELSWMFFESAYHLEPPKQGFRAYALFREALKESGRVGIGTIVLRQRQHLAAVHPDGEALVLETMKFAHELRSADALDLPRNVEVDPRELKLAHQLIDALAGEWDPSRYRDTYTETMREVIQSKLEGKETARPAPRKPAQVRDLMEALRESLQDRPLAKAEGRAAARTGSAARGEKAVARRRAARSKIA